MFIVINKTKRNNNDNSNSSTELFLWQQRLKRRQEAL
jgi:hypothetical protein